MKCPFCNHTESKVIDSRPTEDGTAIRRRRECSLCKQRITTYERVDEIPILIVKKDGTRELYKRSKVIDGILRACEKRPITSDQIEHLVSTIESKIHSYMEKEIRSELIGELVMSGLRDLDEVAYVRFASVYRRFKDINTFVHEINRLIDDKESE